MLGTMLLTLPAFDTVRGFSQSHVSGVMVVSLLCAGNLRFAKFADLIHQLKIIRKPTFRFWAQKKLPAYTGSLIFRLFGFSIRNKMCNFLRRYPAHKL